MSETTRVRTSPKKVRKPRAHTLLLWDAIAEVTNTYDRMTVRQLFYQLVARGVIEKTEQAYKRVSDASVQMRHSGILPYAKIVDGNRERQIRPAYSGIHDAIESMHRFYHKDYWAAQPFHVEVWCEKDALSGLINPICRRYGIPYVAARGFSSVSVRYETAEEMKAAAKPAIIFYFGDHDASGHSATNVLEAELAGRHGADVYIERVALNDDQVRAYGLPTRPGKWSDSRHAKFAAQYGDRVTELDALPPDVLSAMVRTSIAEVIDHDAWGRVEAVEDLERRTLESLATIQWEPGRLYHLGDDAA